MSAMTGGARASSLCILTALAALQSASAFADCEKLPTSAGVVGYCVTITDRTRNPDILYYFHGATTGDDPEKGWARGDPMLLTVWHEAQLVPPTIVAISWGSIWVLKDEKLIAFRDEIIPQIEARIAHPGIGRRMVHGGSMGGLNAFLAWTHMPHLFQAAAFQCPFFTKFNPFASARKRLHFAQTMHNVRAGSRPQRSAAIEENTKLLDMVIVGFKPHFSSFSDWMQHQPPFMMTRLKGQRLPPAYIVYSKRDQFGLNGAPEIGASGQSVVYEAIDGIHCERTATIGLARFLSDHPQMPHRGN